MQRQIRGAAFAKAAAGSLRVEGKAGLRQVRVTGTARASSQQFLNVRNVTGSFTVETDGSGGIYATDVRGSVVVENDGSGEIEVNKVGRLTGPLAFEVQPAKG